MTGGGCCSLSTRASQNTTWFAEFVNHIQQIKGDVNNISTMQFLTGIPRNTLWESYLYYHLLSFTGSCKIMHWGILSISHIIIHGNFQSSRRLDFSRISWMVTTRQLKKISIVCYKISILFLCKSQRRHNIWQSHFRREK